MSNNFNEEYTRQIKRQTIISKAVLSVLFIPFTPAIFVGFILCFCHVMFQIGWFLASLILEALTGESIEDKTDE